MSYDLFDRRDPGRRCTLYVKNLSWDTSAATLGRAFERIGPIVRCDRPGRKEIAFVEFRDWRDAREAYDRMHGARVDGAIISVEYARQQNPGPSWRANLDPPRRRSRSRSRSPRRYDDRDRYDRSPPRYERARSRSPVRDYNTASNSYPTPGGSGKNDDHDKVRIERDDYGRGRNERRSSFSPRGAGY